MLSKEKCDDIIGASGAKRITSGGSAWLLDDLKCGVETRGSGLLDYLFREFGTATATGGHAERVSEIMHASGAISNRVANLVFCDSIAETDIHVPVLQLTTIPKQ